MAAGKWWLSPVFRYDHRAGIEPIAKRQQPTARVLADQWIDLASDRLGGAVVAASDEFFGPKESLIKAAPSVLIVDRYTEHGKWMDGWETRRRRGPGHDWCVVRLAAPAEIHGIVVDTSHFRGNQPAAASLDACRLDDEPGADAWTRSDIGWSRVVEEREVAEDAENAFGAERDGCFTHVRLNIYPDGGVARLRVYGVARADWPALVANGPADLAAARHGGRICACSDACFSRPHNLIMPDTGAHMGDGWETRRRRGPGHDWCVVELGARGVVERVEVDTRHFKGNYPDRFSLDVADGKSDDVDALRWIELLPATKLGPDQPHAFDTPGGPPCTHARFNIHPDGGVSRLRLYGRPTE